MAKLLYVFRDCYEKELHYLGRLLRKGDVFLDVGANYGIYSVLASRLVGSEGRVLAFEPAADTFAWLQGNLARNACRNAIAFEAALCGWEGEVMLWDHQRDDPGRRSTVRSRAAGAGRRVACTTLDHVVEAEGLSRLEVVKIDVEGAEAGVLAGGRWALRKFRPIVICEVDPSVTVSDVGQHVSASAWFRKLGYRPAVLGSNGRLAEVDSRDVRFGNFVWVPEKRPPQLPSC
ncbi:MAG: FkbM family methyltransferase [Planctomycetota bacterium]